MIQNFLCDDCSHRVICDKRKILLKFHESAKHDLRVALTMDECGDFVPEPLETPGGWSGAAGMKFRLE